MSTKIITLSLPAELLRIISLQAKLNYSSRSEYIKSAIIARLKADGSFGVLPPVKQAINQPTIAQVPQTPYEAQRAQLEVFLKEYELNKDSL